ncbi:hypothetical protein BO82DRAFT_395172 [Aspergillus uvarum CBS 121591]|uniref:Uncharacterized protein n=1 Tax=Aspergillus uvarum CBS 121591 TaxID=1448315 RepID=A0A319DD01_9EURO|nr:hypothetical protein BO82DRAFT_395172 [Aspergillus uvarum CBS 121591]PYH77742.1 hypothetical protein BO82DRAFT_395172 [Aspergillus uvarum CBS 121591]
MPFHGRCRARDFKLRAYPIITLQVIYGLCYTVESMRHTSSQSLPPTVGDHCRYCVEGHAQHIEITQDWSGRVYCLRERAELGKHLQVEVLWVDQLGERRITNSVT